MIQMGTLVKEALHDCDYTHTKSAHWCDGISEYISLHRDAKGYWLYAAWDQKHMNEIMDQLYAQKAGWA